VLSLKRYRLRPASSCPDIISVATADDKNGHVSVHLAKTHLNWEFNIEGIFTVFC